MSFGFGIGDFIAVIELANKVRKDFAGAPSQFQQITAEVRSLDIILNDIDPFVSDDITAAQRESLGKITDSCRGVLDDIRLTQSKYSNLESQATGLRRAKRAWRQLKWEPEDIRDLRARTISNIALLNSFLDGLTRREVAKIGEEVGKLADQQQNQERDKILNWITPTDHAAQQSDYLHRREPGTGVWLLESPEYQRWMADKAETLFCPGIPGAGKTILTSIVVEDLFDKFGDDPTVGISYIYCNFRRRDEQRLADLAASLLKQLAQTQSPLDPGIKALYEKHKDRQTRPSSDELWTTFHSVAAAYKRVFVVVDALDECQDYDGCRQKLTSKLLELQARLGANILATSRFIPGIVASFDTGATLEIRASKSDISRYVDSSISNLPGFISGNLGLQHEVKESINKCVDGMFLLAQLHLDSLKGKRSPKAVRAALKRLEAGSVAYDVAYKNAMDRIDGQLLDQRDLAMQTLSWITCAKRPLKTIELRDALAVELGESNLDEENFPDLQDVVSSCCGLVTVDEESDIIRLVHFTTQEYFERTEKTWFPQAQTELMLICTTYLSFDEFGSGTCATDEEFEQRLSTWPLYDYASRYWGHHAYVSGDQQLVVPFLMNQPKVDASWQALSAIRGWPNSSRTIAKGMSGLHIAAHFGLKEAVADLQKFDAVNAVNTWKQTPLFLAAAQGHEEVARSLLENEAKADVVDTHGKTPLSYAAQNGCEAVVRLFIKAFENLDIDFDSRDHNKGLPLTYAAENGHTEIVKLLLAIEKVDPDSKHHWFGQTPLSWAARKGHTDIVKLLLAIEKVDPDSKDNGDRTPLSYAAKKGHTDIVKLLLAIEKVDPDSKDNGDRTPLSYAAKKGHTDIVKLLLAIEKVDPDSKDNEDRTPLSWAAENGHTEIVKRLLAIERVDPDSKDNKDRTPLSWAAGNGLSWAAGNGHTDIVKLLLAIEKVDPNSKDNSGRTPLYWAADNGLSLVGENPHTDIVKLLLAIEKVDPNSKNNKDRTLLSWAAENGRTDIVKLLLAIEKVDPDSKDNDNRTPLSWAAEKGRTHIVKLLLAIEKVDPDSKDNDDRTPLSWAAEEGHTDIVKLLLAIEKVDPNSKDTSGRTPLSWAAENRLSWASGHGHTDIIKLLLAIEKVDPNSKDNKDRTPLSWAAEEGHTDIVKLLLSTEKVNPNSKDNEDRTPLSRAAENGHTHIVKLLLATKKVDPNSKDNEDRTPLSWATENGHTDIVKVLLAIEKVDPDSKGYKGRTPLSWAAEEGHIEIVKRLLAIEKVDPDSKDNEDRTPLSWASGNGRTDIVKQLLAIEKVDPNSKDNSGRTPLSWAAEKGLPWAAEEGRTDIVKLLLAIEKVDPDSKDNSGRTPLSWAAEKGLPWASGNGRTDIVKLLLAIEKVDPDSKDNSGRTPLSWAAGNGLSWAAGNGHTDIIKLLLATEKVNPDSKGYKGRTPLSYAADYGHEDICQLLLATQKVSLDSVDEGGNTPLALAARNNRHNIVKLLSVDRWADPKSNVGIEQAPEEHYDRP